MTKFEALVSNAQYAVYVLFYPASGAFEFVEFEAEAELPAGVTEGGVLFGGVAGMVAGRPSIALNVELSQEGIETLCNAFAAHLAERFEMSIAAMPQAKPAAPDSVSPEFCESLYRLEDTREGHA